jgi:hypothetical protein
MVQRQSKRLTARTIPRKKIWAKLLPTTGPKAVQKAYSKNNTAQEDMGEIAPYNFVSQYCSLPQTFHGIR